MTVIHRYWHGDNETPLGSWGVRAITETQAVPPTDWAPASLPRHIASRVPVGCSPRAASNIVRTALLAEQGGLWLDHDVIPLVPLVGATHPWTASLGRGSEGGPREGGIMWFPEPGHPLLPVVLRQVLRNPERSMASILTATADDFPDVKADATVLGFDASGRRLTRTPRAVHLWSSSRVAYDPARRSR